MKDNIKGEESPSFTNASGESVTIAVGTSEEETAICLLQILRDDHQEAANALAAEVHRSISIDKELHEDIPELPNDTDYSKLGIWIDPIGKNFLKF